MIEPHAHSGLHGSDLDRRRYDHPARQHRCSATRRSRTTSTPVRSPSATMSFVGEASVLDINTAIEDGTQLGHASSLQVGQRVPKGKRYHGSPAQETTRELLHRVERCRAARCGVGSMPARSSGLVLPGSSRLLCWRSITCCRSLIVASSVTLIDHAAPGAEMLWLAGEIMLVTFVLLIGCARDRPADRRHRAEAPRPVPAGGQDLRALRRALLHLSDDLAPEQRGLSSACCSATARSSSTT